MTLRFFSLIVAATFFYCPIIFAAETMSTPANSHTNSTTCKNSLWEFTFQYPSKWQAYFNYDNPRTVDSCDADPEIPRGVTVGPKHSDYYGFHVDFCNSDCMRSTIYADVKTLDQYLSRNPYDVQGDPVISKTNVAGENAVILRSGTIILFHNAQRYILMCHNPGRIDDDQKKLATCYAVRDTFRFVQN